MVDRSIGLTEATLSVYIDYDQFLSADQLAGIITTLDRIYTTLYVSLDPDIGLPLPLESRMRLSEVRTGGSILLDLAEGIRQNWEFMTPLGLPLVMKSIIINMTKGFIEIRKSWYESEEQRLKVEQLKRQLESRDGGNRDRPVQAEQIDLSAVPPAAQMEIEQAALQFVAGIERSPNITVVRIDDVVILDRRT